MQGELCGGPPRMVKPMGVSPAKPGVYHLELIKMAVLLVAHLLAMMKGRKA